MLFIYGVVKVAVAFEEEPVNVTTDDSVTAVTWDISVLDGIDVTSTLYRWESDELGPRQIPLSVTTLLSTSNGDEVFDDGYFDLGAGPIDRIESDLSDGL